MTLRRRSVIHSRSNSFRFQGSGIELGAGDHVDHFGDDLLVALGIAADGALVFATDLRRLGRKRCSGQVVRCIPSRVRPCYAGPRLGMQFLVDRLPPRRLRSPLCRRQLMPELRSGTLALAPRP